MLNHVPLELAPTLSESTFDFEALRRSLAHELAAVGEEIDRLGLPETSIDREARGLLAAGGKRLRPACVILASRLGTGFDARALDLAVAVELVHSATLLHDDILDGALLRRGRPSARAVVGEGGAVLSGDRLLLQGLQRVAASGAEGALEDLMAAIQGMITAEGLQLDCTAEEVSRSRYFAIAEGKTVQLFRWALQWGARVAQVSPSTCESLGRFAEELGLAFQMADDTLDLVASSLRTGKDCRQDLANGRPSYPLIVALERRPELRERIGQSGADARRLSEALLDDEVQRHCLRDLRQRLRRARQALSDIRHCETRHHLESLTDWVETKALSSTRTRPLVEA
ncbi:MAG: polyprenyl synthetase family protein [Acidobacteriota bacterium]